MKKTTKSKYLSKIDNQLEENNININNEILIINIKDYNELLQSVPELSEDELVKFWSLVIQSPELPLKDRLTASDKLAKYKGMYEKCKTIGTSGGAVYKWKSTVEAEIVHEENTTPPVSVEEV